MITELKRNLALREIIQRAVDRIHLGIKGFDRFTSLETLESIFKKMDKSVLRQLASLESKLKMKKCDYIIMLVDAEPESHKLIASDTGRKFVDSENDVFSKFVSYCEMFNASLNLTALKENMKEAPDDTSTCDRKWESHDHRDQDVGPSGDKDGGDSIRSPGKKEVSVAGNISEGTHTSGDNIEQTALEGRKNVEVPVETHQKPEKAHRCQFCHTVFPSRTEHMTHMSDKHNKEPIKCEHCPELMLSKGELLRHTRLKHKGLSRKSKKRKNTEGMEEEKGDVSLEEKVYSVGGNPDNYGDDSKNPNEGVYLQNLHQNSEDASSVKEEQDKNIAFVLNKLSSPSAIEIKQEVKNQGRQSLTCDFPDCSQVFSSKTQYKKHKKSHSRKDNPTNKCSECLQVFPTYKKMQLHVKKCHKDLKPFICEQCGLKFSSKQKLVVHLRSHTGERPFTCTECDRSFTDRGNMKKHMLIHQTQGAYICEVCGKNFKQYSGLYTHMNLLHVEEKKFPCPKCPKMFKLKAHFRKHYTSNHMTLEDVETVDFKCFPCPECGKVLASKNTLVAHMRTHTGLKPFACDHCGKTFADKNNRDNHVKIHLNIRPYKCQMCPKSFLFPRDLKRHINVHVNNPEQISISDVIIPQAPEICGDNSAVYMTSDLTTEIPTSEAATNTLQMTEFQMVRSEVTDDLDASKAMTQSLVPLTVQGTYAEGMETTLVLQPFLEVYYDQ